MFGQKSNPTWFFDSLMHQEAVCRLMYLVESQVALGLINGPDGSGRTRVLNRLREELSRTSTSVVSLSLSGVDAETAMWQIANSLCFGLKSNASRRELLQRLRDELIGRSQCGLQTVFLIDDVHRSMDDPSSLVRLLLSVSEQTQGRITVVLASGKSFPAEFADHCLVRVDLAAMDSAESSDFVRTLVKQTLRKASVVDESAIRAVADFGMGNTARITRICELLKVVHETSPESRISEETVEAMVMELSPDSHRPMATPAFSRAS